MERLLVVRLDVRDCEAEVRLNGIVLARADAARPRAIVPVHEYTIAGANRLELVLWPPWPTPPGEAAEAQVPGTPNGNAAAQARILLPRIGATIDAAVARTLAQLDWAPAAGVAYTAPHVIAKEVSLPVSFPRWRWLDAPRADATTALHSQCLALLQSFAQALSAGDPEPFLAATRLRTEEIATAYQRRPEEELVRLRAHLSPRQSSARAMWVLPAAADFALRAVADGRLLECVDGAGRPALGTEPDERGEVTRLPMRLAVSEGRIYVLR